MQQNCLSDFWSRRWNLPAAYTLRTLVFEPIMEGRAVKGEAGMYLIRYSLPSLNKHPCTSGASSGHFDEFAGG
jgi:hypothetical protein